MKRSSVAAARAFSIVLLAVAAATGCASKKPPASKSVVSSVSGSAIYGTFDQQGEAQLKPSSPITHLVVAGDAIYVYTNSNDVYALSQGLDIRFIKRFVGANEGMRPPVVVGDEVFFPTTKGIYVTSKDGVRRPLPLPERLAAEPEDTRPLRNLGVPDIRFEHPLTSNLHVDQRGLLLAGTVAPTGGRLTMIDPHRTDRSVVQDVLLGSVFSTPTALQGISYAATLEGRVFAVAAENRTAWGMEGLSFDTSRPIKAGLVVDEYGLYVASGDGTLYVLDRTTGHIRWRYMSQKSLDATPLVTKDKVYQVVPEVGLVAIAKMEGKLYRDPLWTAGGVTQVLGADDKYVYAVRNAKQLVAIGIADGQEKFSAEGRFDHVVATADNTIFAARSDGAVVKLKRGQYSGDAVATGR